ncbi:MAG TPA: proton-conducting transporter membrane subunit, partial [Polyangiaceae bacterium]|nr:proton-conducting transporter membrane subunit [Polyangiaceae bacterium]
LWPLVVLPVAGVWWWTGRRERLLRRIAVAVAVVEVLLGLWAYRSFVPGVGHADGNDGFQLVDRSVWVRSLGCEWYLGVDGFSLSLVLLTAVAALVALLVADGERRSEGYYAALALLTSGIMGSLVALDLFVLFGAWQAALLGLILLAGGWGGRRGPHAAAKLVAYGAVGSGAMLLAFVALSRASGRAFLVDGFSVAHTTSIPELSRTSFASKAPLVGLPFVEVAWSLLFVAVAFATPVVPLHAWLPDLLEEAPPGAGIVAGAAFVALGPYLLVRVGLGAMPEGARWAGASLAAIGALCALWGALCAMAQRDLRRFAAYATVTAGGACLYGIGALTAQGIAGGAAILFTHGLATTLLLGVTASLSQRMRSVDAQRIGGLMGEAPGLAVFTGVALGVSMGAPGLAGSWGLLLAVVGGFVRHPVLAALLVVALGASTAAHLRIARHVLAGQVDPSWRKSALLAPFGGRIPDAMAVELVALVPLVLLSLLFGLWPAPLLSPVAVAARDTSAVLDPDGPDPTIDRR